MCPEPCVLVVEADAAVRLTLGGDADVAQRALNLINNAGILRDRTFAKMDLLDFRKVIDVHLMGAVNATKAVWAGMRSRG